MELSQCDRLTSEIEQEANLIKPVPPFECRSKIATDLVYCVCKKLGLMSSAEIPVRAAEFLQFLLEDLISKKVTQSSDDLRCDVICCVMLATKLNTSQVALSRKIRQLYPFMTRDFLLAKEMETFARLFERVSRTNLVAGFEILVAAVGLDLQLETLETFLKIGEKVLMLVRLNLASVFLKLNGLDQAEPDELFQFRLVLRNHVLVAAVTIITVCRIMNLDCGRFLEPLASVSKCDAKTLYRISYVILKAMAISITK